VRYGGFDLECAYGFVFHFTGGVQAHEILGRGELNPKAGEHGGFITNIHQPLISVTVLLLSVYLRLE
jgi:hypothetical protein